MTKKDRYGDPITRCPNGHVANDSGQCASPGCAYNHKPNKGR